MDWDLVHLFVDVVDSGSLSEAARRRNITRSGVSHRLKQLEQQVNAQLIRRTTRNLKPTQVGLTLYEYGKRIALEFEAAQAEILSLEKTLSGLVRISVPVALGQKFLAPSLIKFVRDNPKVTLRVLFNNRIQNLIEAEIDIAIKVISVPPEDTVAREICDVHWGFYCSPTYLNEVGHCESPEHLEKLDFLSPQEGRRVDLELISPGRTAQVSLVPRFASESVLFLLDCALNDMGIALIPVYMAHEPLSEGKLIRVLPDYVCNNRGGKLFILTLPNRFPTPAAHALIEQLRAELVEVFS